MCTGWEWDYIDNEMTLIRLAAFNNYWRHHPPTHLLAAGFTGYKYEPPSNNLDEFISLFQQAGGTIDHG